MYPELLQNNLVYRVKKRHLLILLLSIFVLGLNPSFILAADYMDELSAEAGSEPVEATKQKNKVQVQKSQGEYVDSLMDEAGDLSIDKMTTLEEKEIKKIEITDDSSWNFDEQSLGILESGMSQPEFEKSLKRNYFVTYTLYRKLDPVSKSMVYKAYQDDPQIEHTTKIISNLAR